MKKTCSYEHLIQPFMDGELPDDRRRDVERHIARCGTCTAELNSYQKLGGLLHSLPDVEVTGDFDRNFWKKVDDYEGTRLSARKLKALFGGWVARRWAVGLAPLLATLILFSGVYMLKKPFFLDSDEAMLVNQIDLYRDFDVVENLDLLENMDDLDSMDME